MKLELVDEVEEIRTTNNALWMGILKLAIEYAPEKTKVLLLKINQNDSGISERLRRVAQEI